MIDESDSMKMTTEATITTDTPSDDQEPQNTPPLYTLPYYSAEVDALHESIQRAIDLIQFYSEQAEGTATDGTSTTGRINHNNTTTTTTSSTTMTVTHPDEIYQQLDTARNQITKSWQELYTAFQSQTDDNDDENVDHRGSPLSEQEQIRIAYLNMITDSFGNVLENLHNDKNYANNLNVDVLADCLQSGYDLLTQFNASASSTWYDNDFVWNEDEEEEAEGRDNDDDHHMNDNNDDDDDADDDDNNLKTPHERHRQQLGFQEVH